jgi:hypothetical protein
LSFGTSAQWINEIHYDNSGGDTGEGIEVAGPAGTDLSCYTLVPYNGNGGSEYSSTSLSGTIPDEGCGYGAIWFPISGLQNGSPDGIALIDCGGNVVMFLSYEGSFTATDDSAIGVTSTDIGVTESGGTPVGHSLQLTGSGTSYSDFTWQSPSASSNGSLNSGQTIAPCGGVGNTITEGSITGGPFTVDCNGPTTDIGTFNFTSTGTFNVGNTFSAELTSGVVIGTLSASGVDPSGAITITIPSDLATGTYDLQITSSDPNAVSGTVTINVTQTGSCEPPHMKSVIINSCNTSCNEGDNELVFGYSGSYSFLVDESNFNFSYTNTPPTLENYTDNLTNNSATTLALNNECPGTFPFIDAYGTTIPPNSSWILASEALCPTDALDWSGLCFSGPIYMIYSSDPTWSSGGNFSNSTSDIRPYQTSITTASGDTFTIDYETDGSQYPNDDGVFATFDSNGGPATGYGDDDCIIQPVLLPVELASFNGLEINGKNTFFWKTVSERNSSHFELLNSTDGKNWVSTGSVPAAGCTESVMNYSFEHDPKPVINYYRLKQYDLDGSYLIYTKTITIDNREEQKEIVGYYNVLGQEITEDTPGVQIILFSDGTTVKTFK